MSLRAMLPPKLTRADRAFVAFHLDNPEIYLALRKLALDLWEAGRSSYGIKSLFEVVRWHHAIQITATPSNPYRMANAHTAYYARLLMHHESELSGFFKLCTQKSGSFAAVLAALTEGKTLERFHV